MAKIKNFFIAIGRWFKNHAPTKRRLIQIYSALLFNANIKGYFGKGNNIIFRGATKYLCTPGLNCYSCPGAVTACPLGALQNAMAASKTRAPYYIIGIICILGLMLGRTICGFLCPTGLLQDLAYKIKTPKLRKSRFTRIMSYFKYVLLAVFVIAIPIIYQGIPAFCKFICPAGTFGGALFLLLNPNNADLFPMLGILFTIKVVMLVLFIVACIFIYRFFCRFFCPLGAILGFFNKFALIGVTVDNDKCNDCGLCVTKCKMDVKYVGDHECINCGECIPVCNRKAISWKGSKIFLHPSATDDPVPAMATAESVPAQEPVLEAANAVVTAVNVSSDSLSEQDGVSVSTNVAAVAEENTQDEQTGNIQSETPDSNPDNGKQKKPKKSKVLTPEKIAKRNFILQIVAWAAAMVVLVTALVYFNFLAPTNTTAVYALGDRCPDITMQVYDTAGVYENGNKMTEFSTLHNKGTVMVINFWFTTCDPCVEELPEFEKVKEDYGDRIYMVAVHAANGTPDTEVQGFIDNSGWHDWQIIFAQDTKELDAFTTLGGKAAYPVTVIIDINYRISFVRQGKTSEAELKAQIEKAFAG